MSYNGKALHQWWVSDPKRHFNPRHAIHQIFDKEELEILNKLLFGPRKNDQDDFEEGVALLLSVLGFSIVHYGAIKNLREGPDIVAITPLGHIGVVECTIGLLDNKDKLAKLVQRTILIKEGMAKSGYGFLKVQPVIVSALPQKENKGDLDEAGKHSIAVVCRENLETMVNRIKLPLNPEGLFDEAAQLVPRNDQLTLPGSE